MSNYKTFISSLIAASIVASVTNNSADLKGKLLSLNDIPPQIIYVQEDNEYVPFLKISDNYDGNTLLLRQDVLPTQMQIDDNHSYYETSLIDEYLNDEYMSKIEIRDQIPKSSIIITKESAIGNAKTDNKIINRRAFLLSAYELGLLESNNYNGNTFRYFKNPENRFAYLNGQPINWWLRTPNTKSDISSYMIETNTDIKYENINAVNGIRPAICIPNQNIIHKSNDIIAGQTVFVI